MGKHVRRVIIALVRFYPDLRWMNVADVIDVCLSRTSWIKSTTSGLLWLSIDKTGSHGDRSLPSSGMMQAVSVYKMDCVLNN